MFMFTTCSVAIPSSTWFNVMKLFSNSPAPTSRTMEMATSAIMNALRQRMTELPAKCLSLARMASTGFDFDACHAGKIPQIKPVIAETASVNSSTRPLRLAPSRRGM